MHLCGEYQALNDDGAFFMIQRIAVRVLIEHAGSVLVLRRADGRDSILGKYELPGGRVAAGEQPEDAIKRFLGSDIGVKYSKKMSLYDALTYTDADDRDIQYAVFIYKMSLGDTRRAFTLSTHYDKYSWYRQNKIPNEKLTELTRIILGVGALTGLASQGDSVSGVVPLIYTDGGSRGNPGPSATGYVLIDETNEIIEQGGGFLGITTNNQAEYQAVREGLTAAINRGWRRAEVRIDSMLVVNQLNGVYKVKNRELWPIHENINELISRFDKVKFVHVPREMNRLADGMVNKILDEARQGSYNKDAAH